MADPPGIREPSIFETTFVRPMETSARDALRRISYHSHRDQSIAPSTRSLSYGNYQVTQSKPPSRVPSLRPPLLLHTTNPDDVEEQMDIAADTGIPFGYDDRTEFVTKPAKQRTLLGGFFSSFRRLPRVLRHGGKRARKGTDATQGTHLTENTLPVYRSAPSTPVAPGADNTDRTILATPYLHGSGASHRNEPDVPPSLFPGHGRNSSLHISPPTVSEQGRNPSLHISPPTPSEDNVENEINMPTPEFPLDTRQAFDQSSFTAEQPTAIPVPSSPHPTRSPATTRHDILTPHAGHAPSFQEDDEIPVSVNAHPQPSQDYRRMSKTYTLPGNTNTTSMSSSEPSFSSELNGVQRFFSALKNMPWVASDRLTEDYRPGTQRGGWAWKRVSVLSTKSASIIHHVRRRSRRHSTRKPNLTKRFSFKPVQKPLASWYTDLSGKSAGTIEKGLPRPSWVASPELRRGRIDLLSSGTGTRSSVLSSSERTDMSSPPITPISPRSNYVQRRRHPLHSTPKLRPGARTKPRPEHSGRQQRQGERSFHHSDHRYQRETRREQDHRSHRLSPSRTGTPYPSGYAHGYLPSSQAQYQNSPPMVSVPYVVPQYLLHSPVTALESGNLNTQHPVSSDQPESSSHTPPSGHIAAPSPMPLVPAVYMPMIGSPILHQESSPPGLAGRGAYGGSPISHSGYIPGYLPPT